ncbi:hypothetical protein E2562_020134 [Oryza meyeriana var. granulata]|uniref:Protein kinase domain-containing protein n=1 Tax=Oryza meyeriana var. granulata TaxID=110450 RepID=A0A6G1BM22_9ORYZ|nr:hypothetical protein E2562_020134 [Oryza meyeriana var. granulata]
MSGAGLAEKGTAAWPADWNHSMRLKLSARTLPSHYLNSRKVRQRCHWMALLLWVFSWSLLSLWILSFMSSKAAVMRRGALANMCDERARMLEDQVKVSMNHLQALAILVSTFHHSKSASAIDQMTFARYKIVLDLVSGLLYLHRDCEKCIVHGDIKPANQDPFERPSIAQAMDVLRPADADLPLLLPAAYDTMEEQAYADLPVGDRSSAHAVTPALVVTPMLLMLPRPTIPRPTIAIPPTRLMNSLL